MRITLTHTPLWAALVPLAAYLVILGCLHLRRRPVAVSGQVDAVLLAAAVSGLVIAGPLATASKQPRLPQPHRGPPGTIV